MLSFMSPEEFQTFRNGHWPHQPFACPGRPDRAAALTGIPELADVDSLLACYNAPVSQRRPDGTAGRVQSAQAAREAYDAGATLYFRKVQNFVPALDSILGATAQSLGLCPGLFSAEVFASSGTSGLAMHADYDVNFQILLRGNKTWRVAENTHVRNPTEMCLPESQGIFDPFQHEIADRTPFPDAMPKEAMQFRMGAGSLLFVPCGWWHETSAEGECFALNIVCKGPRMADVIADGLRRRLYREPQWREYACGVFSDDPEATVPEGMMSINAMTSQLQQLFASLSPEQLAQELVKEFSSLHKPRC